MNRNRNKNSRTRDRYRQRMIKTGVCLFLLLCLTGCWSAREVNDLEIVIGVGVDKSDIPDNIRFTAQIVKPGEMRQPAQEGGGGSGSAFWNVQSTGTSLFNAVRDITHKTGNRLFVSHSQLVVFGNEIAAEGIEKYMDFFLRTHEMRPTALILIANGTAEDVLNIKPEKEKLPAMHIAKLIDAYGFTSHFIKMNLQDFSTRMMSKTSSPIAPLVEVSRDAENPDFRFSGLAVFKNLKMVGALNRDEARGLLWVTGDVKSGIINVTGPDGQGMVVLEILKVKSKVTPQFKEGKLYMHIEIKEEASITEQLTEESLVTVPALELLQKKQEEIIRGEITAAFEKSKELGTDVFDFGEMVHKKYRSEWEQMEQDWDSVYKSIELSVDVDARIVKTDLITKPAVPEKGEK